jgi:hypothetical protein
MTRGAAVLVLVLALAVNAGCTAGQARVVRALGYGLAIEGGAVFAASSVTADPHASVGDAVARASPLIIAGIVAIVAGRPSPWSQQIVQGGPVRQRATRSR